MEAIMFEMEEELVSRHNLLSRLQHLSTSALMVPSECRSQGTTS